MIHNSSITKFTAVQISYQHRCVSFHTDGEDYTGGLFTVTLSMGMSQNCFSISIIDDSMPEEEIETFQVFLSNFDPGVDSSASMATVQIFDDDG